jgi:hypothetical protein
MDRYAERVAEIEERERVGGYAEYRRSPGFRAHECVMLQPPCDCSIEGDGNLQSPLRVKFCAAHARAGFAVKSEGSTTATARPPVVYVCGHPYVVADILRELVDAAEDMASSDPDMPSHADAESRFEAAMARAREAVG